MSNGSHTEFPLRSCLKGPQPPGQKRMVLLKSKLMLCLLVCSVAASAWAQTPGVALGTVKSINGNAIVLATDAGETVNVTVQDNARLQRIAPGETSLKNATPLALTDIQKDDRIRVRGTLAADGKTIQAVSVIAIKKEDVAQKQQKDLQDWNRRGAGGLVKSVDAANSTVNISVTGIGGTKEVAIKWSPSTKIRR